MYMADVALIVYVLLVVIGLLIALRVLRYLLRQIVSLWSRSGNLFGSDARTRLISLGIAALFFPKTIASIVYAIISFIGNFFIDAPQALLANWQLAQSACVDNLSLCLGQMSIAFAGGWREAFSRALTRFGGSYISYSQLILMLAIWAMVALLLSARSEGEGDDVTHVKSWLRSLDVPTRQNIVFFLIIALAGYLSIAAIAAIPGLLEPATASESVSVEFLDQQLTKALADSSGRIPTELELGLANPFTELKDYFESHPTVEASLKRTVDDQGTAYQQMIDQYANLRDDLLTKAEGDRVEAVTIYRTSTVDRKGTKETVQHFLLINQWFHQSLIDVERNLDDCRTSIVYVNNQLARWAKSTQTQLSTNPTDNVDTALGNVTYDFPFDIYGTPFEICQSSVSASTVPERPDLGSNLGPFSYVASWLLRTESLPLAQIVGMLGFGLLGSAVSSLVRSETKKLENEPLVKDLTTVVIRGATAAVVVFLSVKGGLAIFSSGENEPNSYVLLLTCLVAAVYGEDVWKKAHNWLLQNAGTNGPQPPPAAQPPAAGSGQQGTAPAPQNSPPPVQKTDSVTTDDEARHE